MGEEKEKKAAEAGKLTVSEAANKRIIIFNQIDWMETIAKALAEEFGPKG